jgi:hypothetical protein
MSMTANDGPHEVVVEPPDADGVLVIDCQTCPWETTATDPMFVDSIVMRHGIITGTIRLK